MKAFLEKFSFENNKLIKIEAWFPSNTYTVLDSIHIRKKINTAIRDIYKRYDSFVQRGSGWVLKKVSKFSVSIMKFKLFQGGCLSALLPREYPRRKVLSRGLRYQYQADLVDYSALKRDNCSFTFLLTIIDIFSRFALAIPIKSKKGSHVATALEKAFKVMKPPRKITN